MRFKPTTGLIGMISAISGLPAVASAQFNPSTLYATAYVKGHQADDKSGIGILREEEREKDKTVGEPINPFLNSLMTLRITNILEVEAPDGYGYRRKTVIGEGALQDSQVHIYFYPKYQEGEFEVRVSLEGTLMQTFSGEFKSGKELISAGMIDIASYREKMNSKRPCPVDGSLSLTIEAYRIFCGSEIPSEPEETRGVIVDQTMTYAESLNFPKIMAR